MTVDQFWNLLERVDGPGACWIWRGGKDRKGYGVLRLNHMPRNASIRSHRLAYELVVGPIPDGLEIDHLCRNTSCANPAHLEPVAHAENQRRRALVITHCVHGHEYTPENTGVSRRGNGCTNRSCKTCDRDRMRARRAATRFSTKGSA